LLEFRPGMLPRQKIDEVVRAGKVLGWRVSTIARVGSRLGMHRAVTWPGAKVLLTNVPRGKANPSLIFRFYAANDPDRTAFVQARGGEEVRRISYHEANEAMDRLGAALGRRGLGKGSAALMLVKNRVEFFLVQAALGRIGGSAVTASWRSSVPEIEYLAHHSGARAVFFDADIEPTVRDAIPRLRGIAPGNYFSVGGAVSGFASLEDLLRERGGAPVDHSEEAAVVMYTSGTTGKPKGAVRSIQPDALAGALSFIDETPMRLGEVHLTVCPLYHATAFGFSGFALLLGGTIVVMGDYKPDAFLDAIERFRVTSTAMVPTMIHRLVELGEDAARRRDTSSLRAIFSGGAPLGGQLAIEAMDLLGDKIYNFYGATETGMVTLAKPADLRRSPGTIGRAVAGAEVRLVDDRGRDVPEGEVGELYARTPMMVSGYHADEAATRASMLGGHFSVGDLARRDARGCFHIEGRKRDMIISGGTNVYPAEVEAVIEAHPAVAEVAVVGVPDREWGERVRAFVVRRAGKDVSDDDLRAHCRAELAGYKVPRDFVFLDSLPRNPTGKVLKRDLRQMEIG
jgi:acyl-CoA synthetase (AMP-forming)/AMP-acid ligase II